MKNIAIITGATGGIGREFVRQVSDLEIDEIWAVGRNERILSEFSGNIVTIKADISKHEGIEVIRDRLKSEMPNVRLLVNNAGIAYMGKYTEMREEQITSMISVNCTACALLTRIVLNHMKSGAVIFNVSSASSFQPNPYLTLYSASKVFVKNFSRALNVELKAQKIRSVAVCPGWVDTDMLPRERQGKPIRYPGMVSPKKVVTHALKDAKRGKDVSVSSLYNKMLRILVKLYPTRIVMKTWTRGIKDYL